MGQRMMGQRGSSGNLSFCWVFLKFVGYNQISILNNILVAGLKSFLPLLNCTCSNSRGYQKLALSLFQPIGVKGYLCTDCKDYYRGGLLISTAGYLMRHSTVSLSDFVQSLPTMRGDCLIN